MMVIETDELHEYKKRATSCMHTVQSWNNFCNETCQKLVKDVLCV